MRNGDPLPELGSDEATVKLKEGEALEKAIKQGVDRAFENDASVKFHEESASQFSSNDRGHF